MYFGSVATILNGLGAGARSQVRLGYRIYGVKVLWGSYDSMKKRATGAKAHLQSTGAHLRGLKA